MQVITMTAFRRPAYTREVLSALARCAGVADWLLLPTVEPGNEEVIEAFHSWTASPCRLQVNRVRLGLNRNTHAALLRAAEAGAETIVHLEDDTVPSPDALSYFCWVVEELLSRDEFHQVLLASGYNKPSREPSQGESHQSGTRPIWTPWGWAVDHARLQWLIANWCHRNPKCFTCSFKSRFRRTHQEVFPRLSRIQNIGYELGENNRTPQWYRANHRTPWVAGEIETASFRLESAAPQPHA